MKEYNYNITPKIRDFIIRNTKLNLTPVKGVIGYNHLMHQGASKRNISSDVAFYLLINDINSLSIKLSKILDVNLSESKLCALISYFHSKHLDPNTTSLSVLNQGKYKLFGEQTFLIWQDTKEARALRSLEYKLWNEDTGIYLNSKILVF